MKELIPILKENANGREISGLKIYEKYMWLEKDSRKDIWRQQTNSIAAITIRIPQSPQIAYKPRKYPETTWYTNRSEKIATRASKRATIGLLTPPESPIRIPKTRRNRL